MSVTMAVFTFINAWWIGLFFVFPFMMKAPQSTGIEYQGAPKIILWKKMLLIDTLLAASFTAVLALVIGSGLFHLDTLV